MGAEADPADVQPSEVELRRLPSAALAYHRLAASNRVRRRHGIARHGVALAAVLGSGVKTRTSGIGTHRRGRSFSVAEALVRRGGPQAMNGSALGGEGGVHCASGTRPAAV